MTQQKLHRITADRNKKNPLHLLTVILTVISFTSAYAAPAKLITSFPFKLLTGGIIIVEARLGHHLDTLNFVLDTGSGGISLDSTTVLDLKLPLTPSNRTIRGIAGIRTVSFVMNEKLLLPKLLVDSLNFHVNDYALLTSVYGMKIDGIIGYSFFRRYIVKINYDTHTMEVYQPGEIKYPRRGYMINSTVSNIPIFSASLADNRPVTSRFYFDTGAGLYLLLSEKFVGDSSMLTPGKRIINTQAEGLGGKKPMKITTLKQVTVGPYRFKKVPTYIFDDEFNVTAYPHLGGLVGNDLLRRFNLIINYPENKIHLAPNTHFNEPFDYSYIGLGIFMVDGEVVVEDVIEESPGEKAGFRPGDRIVAVEGNFSNNIQAYKALLQTPGARLKIIVRRESGLKILYLHVASILKK